MDFFITLPHIYQQIKRQTCLKFDFQTFKNICTYYKVKNSRLRNYFNSMTNSLQKLISRMSSIYIFILLWLTKISRAATDRNNWIDPITYWMKGWCLAKVEKKAALPASAAAIQPAYPTFARCQSFIKRWSIQGLNSLTEIFSQLFPFTLWRIAVVALAFQQLLLLNLPTTCYFCSQPFPPPFFCAPLFNGFLQTLVI